MEDQQQRADNLFDELEKLKENAEKAFDIIDKLYCENLEHEGRIKDEKIGFYRFCSRFGSCIKCDIAAVLKKVREGQ